MKKKLFYLVGVAILSCYTCTFTSCVNGVDDEYLDQKYSGNGEANKDDENEIADINGDYSAESDYELKMTYNGEEISGKKVIVLADEKYETATFTLAGTEKDLASLSNLLEGMGATFTTPSVIPGEKEYLIKGVKLYRSGGDFKFEGTQVEPTRTVTYEGNILEGVMSINITHTYADDMKNDLLGAWKMGAVKEIGTGTLPTDLLNNEDNDWTKSSPLFLNWKSDKKVDMGNVATGMDFPASIEVNRPMNGIFNLLMSPLVTSQMVKPSLQKALPLLLEYVAAEKSGGMYASYSYTGAEAPEYSKEMSHNIIRYYFDADGELRIEANVDYLLSSLGGLLGGSETRAITRAQPDNAKVIGKELINKLRPALEQGFPCEYTIDGDNMTINIEGKFLLDVMRTVGNLVNDEYVKDYIYDIIDGEASIAQYAPNIKNLLKNMPNALGDDCEYIKLGFHMVKTTSTE